MTPINNDRQMQQDPEAPPAVTTTTTTTTMPFDEGTEQQQQQHQQQQQEQKQSFSVAATSTTNDNQSHYQSVPESGDATLKKDGFIVAMEHEHDTGTDAVTNTHVGRSTTWLLLSSMTSTLSKTIPGLFSTQVRRKQFVTACYLGVGAIFGTLLRMVMAQLFGEECRSPGTVGWIADDSVLCVTSNGETSTVGGIVFADLPANVLGCFIMGLLQDGKSLELAVHSPLGILKPSSVWQGYDIWHTALKTGFCGSLTTFSGWNSEMVIMILGNADAQLSSQVWKALFGYIIGLEVGLGSYVFGRSVAFWYHQWRNPYLRAEEKAVAVRVTQGMAVNPNLPALERRFLHDLDLAENTTERNRHLIPQLVDTPALAALGRWRSSTKESRRVEHVELSTELMKLETCILAEQRHLTIEQAEFARKNGWDIDSLQEYAATSNRYSSQAYATMSDESEYSLADSGDGGKVDYLTPSGVYKTLSEETSVWYSIPVAFSILTGLILLLVVLVSYVWTDMTESYEITYRTMAYAMMFSTPGALLRWKLGAWYNGKLPIPNWAWFPLGTLLANAIGSMVSMSMIGWEYNLQLSNDASGGFWAVATVRAIKIGFSGCLTTVSTFVSEIHTLSSLRQGRGYKYAIITLVLCCCLAMVLYAIIV